MKKTMGTARALPIVPKANLDRLHTGSLLARLERLRWCEEGPEWSDMDEAELASCDGKILFKSQPEWHQAYRDLKDILKLREHVKKKPR